MMVIYEATAKGIALDMLLSNDYVGARFEHDEGTKLKRWLEERISWYEGVPRGKGKTRDPLMGELLLQDRKMQNRLLRICLLRTRNYTWYQRSLKKSRWLDMSRFDRLSVLFMMQPGQPTVQDPGSKIVCFLWIMGQELIYCSFPGDSVSSLGICQEVSLVPKQNTKSASFIALQVGKPELVDQQVRMISISIFILCRDCIGIPQ